MNKLQIMLLSFLAAPWAWGEAPTFKDLMNPECLPDAQLGMRVESASMDGQTLRITTTGAEFTLDGNGSGLFRQRIGRERDVLRMQIACGPEPLGCMVSHRTTGMAFAISNSPSFDLRANGDSLFMLHALEPMRVTFRREIEPGFFASHRANHVLLDEYGGFGLYCSVQDIQDNFDPLGASNETATASAPSNRGRVVADYDLPGGAVLWIAICPPKAYDWQRSATDQVIWHWTNTQAYPPDDALKSWQPLGNIVLLQSEVMLWKDWNLAFEPRLGPEEFARVRETLHQLGMRFIVYTSPYYFLRGTPKASIAMNSFKNFTGWPSGVDHGDNIEIFLAEITRMTDAHKPDGLYFDGQYVNNPAALYMLARRARAIVGEKGILEWHSTQALGPELCSLPTADAYVDVILRGEGREMMYGDEKYLRYFVSGYNVHNSIGVICNNGQRPTPELVKRLVDVNGRMHTMAGWGPDAKLMELAADYRKQIADVAGVRARVEAGMERRQAAIPGEVKRAVEEFRQLANPPTWKNPVLREEFSSSPGEWTRTVSPVNPDAFEVEDGVLQINAKSHTYAYLERGAPAKLSGFVVKLRRKADEGMSWGPAVCIRWSEHDFLRVGLRSDGLIQADISGDQRLAGSTKAEDWVWLRVRWGERSGIIELSRNGGDFTRLMQFEHAGKFNAKPQNVAVGKIPFNCKPHDYPENGPVRPCEFDSVLFY